MKDVRLVSFRRVFNLGDFENSAVELQAVPGIDDDPGKVLDELASEVESFAKRTYGDHIKEKKQ